MKWNRIFIFPAVTMLMAQYACGNGEQGHSTPIDSVNSNVAPPVTYGPDDPADTSVHNQSDTGTHVDMGPDSPAR